MKRVTRTSFRTPMNNIVLNNAASIRAFADARAGRRAYQAEGIISLILQRIGRALS